MNFKLKYIYVYKKKEKQKNKKIMKKSESFIYFEYNCKII